ncbi:hypothetical protein [Maricurvus nonylphenolicus]|jgi:hypothetical protein
MSDKTEYAKSLGYHGEQSVIVIDGKVVSHGFLDWLAFCYKLRK